MSHVLIPISRIPQYVYVYNIILPIHTQIFSFYPCIPIYYHFTNVYPQNSIWPLISIQYNFTYSYQYNIILPMHTHTISCENNESDECMRQALEAQSNYLLHTPHTPGYLHLQWKGSMTNRQSYIIYLQEWWMDCASTMWVDPSSNVE